MRHFLKWILVIVFFGTMASQSAGKELDLSLAARERALATLREDCANCHGLYRLGGLGPALTPERLKPFSVEALTLIILEGRPALFMPPWKEVLSKAEVQFLANYLLTEQAPVPQFQKIN